MGNFQWRQLQTRASTYAPLTHGPKFVHAMMIVESELPAGHEHDPVTGFG